MKQQATSAATAGPNTPETDRQRYVLHNVTCSYDGKIEKVQIYAEAPDLAIRSVNSLTVAEYLCLERV